MASIQNEKSAGTPHTPSFHHRDILRRSPTFLLLVALQLSSILTYNYYSRVEDPFMDNRIALHNVIVSLKAPYEYRYRVLVPFAVDAVGRKLSQSSPVISDDPLKALPFSRTAFAGLYASANFLAFLVTLGCTGVLLSRFFRYELALFGMVLSAVLIDFTFRDHYFHPWSLWEGAFYAAGLLLIQEKRYWLFTAINILGLLNRETSVFLCIAFLFYVLPLPIRSLRVKLLVRQREFRFAAANLIIWVLGYFALHAAVGYQPLTFFLETAWAGNRARWKYALFLNALFFGPLWILVVKGLRLSPPLIRSASMMIPLYLALLLVLGFWWEIRYWISLIPILVVAVIAAIPEELRHRPNSNRVDAA